MLQKGSICIMMDEKSKIMARNKFALYLESKNLRRTPERFTIIDSIFSQNEYFDVESLHEVLEKKSYHVSRATLYNTIRLLIDCGLVRRHSLENSAPKYEKVVVSSSNHQHLVCMDCGKIKEVKDVEFSAYMNARKFPAFTANYFQLYIYGVCNNCARKRKRNLKEKNNKTTK